MIMYLVDFYDTQITYYYILITHYQDFIYYLLFYAKFLYFIVVFFLMFWRVSHLLKDCCKTACRGILAEASHVFCAFHVSWCSHVTYLHCLDLCKHMLWCSYHKIRLHLSQSPWHLSKRYMQHNSLLLIWIVWDSYYFNNGTSKNCNKELELTVLHEYLRQ